MQKTIVAGISLLLALTAASPVPRFTRLDTFAKRQFAADLVPQLSPGVTVVFPQDAGWQNATVRWNDYLRPTFQAVVEVTNEADIVAVVRYSTQRNITFFAQSGGHGFGPLDSARDAIMINLRNLNTINIDASSGVATIGGGITYEEFVDASYNAGREYPVGSCPCVGFSGAGLGGGIGRLQGLHGLSIDAYRRYRVVLASGEVITVSATENEDLFWGMRGAGQNFGIVVEADVQTYAATNGGSFYSVDLVLSNDQLEAGFEVMNSQIPNMPGELAIEPQFAVNATTMETYITINIVYAGDMEAGRNYSAPWQALNPVSFVEEMRPWNELSIGTAGDCEDNGNFKDIYSANLRTFDIPTMRSLYNSLGEFVQQYPDASQSSMLWEVYGQEGVRAVPVESTAFPNRNQMDILPLIFARWTDPSITDAVDSWLSDMRDQMAATSGYDQLYLYQNYARAEPAQSYYGYEPWRIERLQELKRKYDPTNQFFAYHPIPAATTGGYY